MLTSRLHRWTVPAVASCLVLGVAACESEPQAALPGDGTLGEPAARANRGFTSVFDVAEIGAERVLVTDNMERMVAVVDLTTGEVEPIGREGAGPVEHRGAFNIARFGADTLGVYDSRQRRWLLVVDGEIAGVRPFPTPPLRGFSVPRGPTADGAFLLTSQTTGPNGLVRETPVVRWRPDGETLDTVAAIMAYGPDQARRGLMPLPRGDGWSLLGGGVVARVVADGYRVEWVDPAGARTVGPAVPYEPVPVDEAEREAWIEETFSGAPLGSMSVQGGGDAGDSERTRRRFPPSAFPQMLPLFDRGWLPSSPDGQIWVTRLSQAGADSTTVDVLGRDGHLAHRLRLAGQVRIVHVTDARVYLARKDRTDLEWLEVYARP